MVPLSKSGLRYKRSVGSNPTLSATREPLLAIYFNGEVLEWSIRRAWRARVAFGYRGFESHPLRHPKCFLLDSVSILLYSFAMHPLDGPRVKIERAKSQLALFHATSERFFECNPYRVTVAEFNGKARHYNLRIQGDHVALPLEWSVWVGEIAHNLRSALDGLVWQVTCTPTRNSGFPICLTGWGKGRKGYVPFWRQAPNRRPLQRLDGVNRRFWTRFEAVQPYKRENGYWHSPLVLLNELNISDKHHLITVLAVTIGGIELTGMFGKSTIKRGVNIHPNAIVGHVRELPADGVPVFDIMERRVRIQREVQVDVSIAPEILFGNSCDAVKRLPVIRTLNSMANKVSGIIESFADDS